MVFTGCRQKIGIMCELRFTNAAESNVWFVTGGLSGISGTIAVIEKCGLLCAVGKIKDGKNSPLTTTDVNILKKSYISVGQKILTLSPLSDLPESNEPIDIPINFKFSSLKDRLCQLMFIDCVHYA